LMLSDGDSELLTGGEEPFLVDDLSDATVDSDDDDEDDGGSSHGRRRRSTCPFCLGDVGGTSALLTQLAAGELAMVFSSRRAPLSTSSHPSNSLVGAVDTACM